MFLGKVIGKAILTIKDASLEGGTFLVVEPCNHRGESVGKPLIALDTVQAGPHDLVYLVKGRGGFDPLAQFVFPFGRRHRRDRRWYRLELMLIARVLGPLWATIQDENFRGAKLLLTQPVDVLTGEAVGTEVLAVDVVGAGAGELVLIVYEGSSSRLSPGNERSPAEAVIVGIIDAIDVPPQAPGKSGSEPGLAQPLVTRPTRRTPH